MVVVPTVVRNKAVAAGATRWLAELPTLVERLEQEWGLVLGSSFGDGTEAYVAEATLADGTTAVLKLCVPVSDAAVDHEITTLRLADGHGCARLLRADAERGALLLERLGPSLHDLALPLPQRLEILTSTAAQVWRPAPGAALPTGAAKARSLSASITDMWEQLDHPCSRRAVDDARACASRRFDAHRDERAVLVHGDVHQWNALRSGDGFKLVDPDGLLAEAECDLGVLMREDPIELLHGDPRERARWLARRTGLDADAIWEWGVVERVSTGLLCTQVELQPVGAEMLAVADRVAASRRP